MWKRWRQIALKCVCVRFNKAICTTQIHRHWSPLPNYIHTNETHKIFNCFIACRRTSKFHTKTADCCWNCSVFELCSLRLIALSARLTCDPIFSSLPFYWRYWQLFAHTQKVNNIFVLVSVRWFQLFVKYFSEVKDKPSCCVEELTEKLWRHCSKLSFSISYR